MNSSSARLAPGSSPKALGFLGALALAWATLGAEAPASLDYRVSWVSNSFSGASNRWVQNFLIHTQVQPDGTVNTWSHWDEGGRKFGVYKDGDVLGNTNVNPNSLQTRDKAGHIWKLEVEPGPPVGSVANTGFRRSTSEHLGLVEKNCMATSTYLYGWRRAW